MGIDVWHIRVATDNSASEAEKPRYSWQLSPDELPHWLALQGYRPILPTQKPKTPLLIIGEEHHNTSSDSSLFEGEAAQLLDAMLSAIQLHRDDTLLVELKQGVGQSAPTIGDLLSSTLIKVILFVGMPPAGSDGLYNHSLISPSLCLQQAPIVLSLHPCHLLAHPSAKRQAWEDLKQVRSLLAPS